MNVERPVGAEDTAQGKCELRRTEVIVEAALRDSDGMVELSFPKVAMF